MSYGETLGRDFKNARRSVPGGVLALSGRTGLVVGLLVGVVIGFGLAAVTLRSDQNAGAPMLQPAQSLPDTGGTAVAGDPAPGPAIPAGLEFPDILPNESVDVPQGPAPTMMLPPEPSDESSVIDTSPP